MDILENVSSEVKTWFIKWLIPTLIGVSISIVMRMQETKATWIGVFITFTCGVGFSYLFWFTKGYISSAFQPFFIATVAMSGEKIGKWMVRGSLFVPSLMMMSI